VELRSSNSLKSGDAVYLAGVQIGETGEATVVGGKAQVPVRLYRKQKNAVPAGTVFLITSDDRRPEHSSLVGYGAVLADRSRLSSEIFQGATNWLEMAALVGAEKSKDLANRLTR